MRTRTPACRVTVYEADMRQRECSRHRALGATRSARLPSQRQADEQPPFHAGRLGSEGRQAPARRLDRQPQWPPGDAEQRWAASDRPIRMRPSGDVRRSTDGKRRPAELAPSPCSPALSPWPSVVSFRRFRLGATTILPAQQEEFQLILHRIQLIDPSINGGHLGGNTLLECRTITHTSTAHFQNTSHIGDRDIHGP